MNEHIHLGMPRETIAGILSQRKQLPGILLDCIVVVTAMLPCAKLIVQCIADRPAVGEFIMWSFLWDWSLWDAALGAVALIVLFLHGYWLQDRKYLLPDEMQAYREGMDENR
ncbi:hypothetical protein D2T29_12890 [Sinirhodobacter populi]|uniref:Uncharacterized protein n=1 Tax=Paenirhodobacter populi TaxID=2306993 RepID=A0A443KD50_9RHOB|nr:hypothetical protein [Sinirhodobacter populi]RWR30562.1 hypothetical protein D2T29_12890 [Sinirhodobacter populi]